MSTMRAAMLGLFALVTAIGLAYGWSSQKEAERVRDYANYMSEIQAKAMALYDDANGKHQEMENHLRRGIEPQLDEVVDAKDAYLLVAANTKELKKTFSMVIPPSEGQELQGLAVEYLDLRVLRAENMAKYFELAEKGTRGQSVSESQIRAVVVKAETLQKQVMDKAKAVANEKDELMLK